MKTQTKWTHEQTNFLIENYPKTSRQYCAEKLNLSVDVVDSKIWKLRLTKPKKWTQDQIDFLIDNYYKTSCKYCADKLNLPNDIVYGKIRRLKLKKECKYNLEQFQNIKSKYVAYLLGVIWADGHIDNDSVRLSIIETDGIVIKPIYDEIGYYRLIRVNANGKNKSQYTFHLNSIELTNIFREYEYDIKSIASPDRLLNLIPDNLKLYFYRGLIDGDGCFYINRKHHTYQFCLSSTISQDWSYMISLCNLLGVSRYKIDRASKISKKTGNPHEYSVFRICRKNDIKILGDYIYNDYDEIGLKRKFFKYKQIREIC